MRLPATIQAHLAGTELTDLKELAQLADRLWQCDGYARNKCNVTWTGLNQSMCKLVTQTVIFNLVIRNNLAI